MRRARGCGLFSSQRLPADATVPRRQATPADPAKAQRFWTLLSCRMAGIGLIGARH